MKDIYYSPIVGEAGQCPRLDIWEMRLNQFRQIEFNSFGDNSHSPSPQNQALLHELEHLYCSGAWLAVVVFSYAMIDIHLAHTDMPSETKAGKAARNSYLTKHGLSNEVELLRKTRNSLVHLQNIAKKTEITDVWKVLFKRDELFQNAKSAIQTAFRVVLLETKISLN